MHLQHHVHIRKELFFCEMLVDTHHGNADNVCRCPLHRRIDCHSLCLCTDEWSARIHAREVASAPKVRFCVPIRTRVCFCLFEVLGKPCECVEVCIKELLCLSTTRPLAQIGTERIDPHAIENTEINHLCLPAHVRSHLAKLHVKYARRNSLVYILPIFENLNELFIS